MGCWYVWIETCWMRFSKWKSLLGGYRLDTLGLFFSFGKKRRTLTEYEERKKKEKLELLARFYRTECAYFICIKKYIEMFAVTQMCCMGIFLHHHIEYGVGVLRIVHRHMRITISHRHFASELGLRNSHTHIHSFTYCRDVDDTYQSQQDEMDGR